MRQSNGNTHDFCRKTKSGLDHDELAATSLHINIHKFFVTPDSMTLDIFSVNGSDLAY